MSGLVARALTWCRNAIGGTAARGAAYPARKLGAQTARFLRAIGPSLTSSELGWIISLGESEGVIQELRASLRDVYLDMAAVDRDAIAMKERIDAFLSEPGGSLARTLAPIRDQAPSESKRSIERALDAASRLVTEARSVLDTADTLVAARARLEGVAARHQDVLPETLEKMLRGTKVSDRLKAISSPVSARYLLAGVGEMEQSVERQRACYEELALQLERSALAVGIEPERVRSKTRGLEEYTRELATLLDAACADRHGAALKKTLRTAHRHQKRLQADGRFARSHEQVAGMPSHKAILEWKALHAMHPRPVTREDGA